MMSHMFFSMFQSDPLLFIPWCAALLIAITVHEFSHGFVAYQLGDDTAQRAGRLSLNPFAHLDVVGSFLLILVGFGWARPVPINPSRIGKGKKGQFLVSFAGIFANIVLAMLCAAALKALWAFAGINSFNYLVQFLLFLIYINLALFVFNLIPIAPLDGYRIFETIAPRAFFRWAPIIERYGFFILLFLVFLTPIVPMLINFCLVVFSTLWGQPLPYLLGT